MVRISEVEINNLASKFSDKSLPKIEWNHQVHIIVAFWHNMNYDFDIALDLVKSKIKSYNLSVGTLNTNDSGYHETLTIFWMKLTKSFLIKHPSLKIEDVVFQFLSSEFSTKKFPFDFYSREILFSKMARKEWVDGDIKSVLF